MATEVKFSFENEEAAHNFMTWLQERGEQDYWEWMRYREQEQTEGDITVLQFDYNFGTYKVKTLLGRLDES